MKIRWKKLLLTTACWLTTEMYFNFIGIDDLADYSEFVLNQQIALGASDRFS